MKRFFQHAGGLLAGKRLLRPALLSASLEPCLPSASSTPSPPKSLLPDSLRTNSIVSRALPCATSTSRLTTLSFRATPQPRPAAFSTETGADEDAAPKYLRGDNLYDVVAKLPVPENLEGKKTWPNKNGRGLRFARKIWKYRYPEPCYWTITKFKPRDEHKHKAKAWGILTWRGVPAHKPTLIRGSRKRQWELFAVQARDDGKYVFATGPDPSLAKKQKREERKKQRQLIEQEVKAVWNAKLKALQDLRAEKERILAEEEEATQRAGEEAERRVAEGRNKMRVLEEKRRAEQQVARISQP